MPMLGPARLEKFIIIMSVEGRKNILVVRIRLTGKQSLKILLLNRPRKTFFKEGVIDMIADKIMAIQKKKSGVRL